MIAKKPRKQSNLNAWSVSDGKVANAAFPRNNSGMRTALLMLATMPLSGCLAAEIVTAPIDAITTTQSEADEDRGKALRKREERLGKLERQYRKEREDCDDGDKKACAKAAEISDKGLRFHFS